METTKNAGLHRRADRRSLLRRLAHTAARVRAEAEIGMIADQWSRRSEPLVVDGEAAPRPRREMEPETPVSFSLAVLGRADLDGFQAPDRLEAGVSALQAGFSRTEARGLKGGARVTARLDARSCEERAHRVGWSRVNAQWIRASDIRTPCGVHLRSNGPCDGWIEVDLPSGQARREPN